MCLITMADHIYTNLNISPLCLWPYVLKYKCSSIANQ